MRFLSSLPIRVVTATLLGLLTIGVVSPVQAQPDAPENVQKPPAPLEGCRDLDYTVQTTFDYLRWVDEGKVAYPEGREEFLVGEPSEGSPFATDSNQPNGLRKAISINRAPDGQQSAVARVEFYGLRSDTGWFCYNTRQSWRLSKYNKKPDNNLDRNGNAHNTDIIRLIRLPGQDWQERATQVDSAGISYNSRWWQYRIAVPVGVEFDYAIELQTEEPDFDRILSAENFSTIFAQRAERPVGIEERPQDASIRLFPNPARNHVTLDGFNTRDPLNQVQVFDLIGRRVLSQHGSRSRDRLDLSSLATGRYHVVATLRSGQRVLRALTVVR